MGYLWIVAVLSLWCMSTADDKDFTKKEKKELNCAVCRAVVREINLKIQAVNPKKTLQAGNYRIDGQGNQATKLVGYARSETHLVEVMETICVEMGKYGITTLITGKKSLSESSHTKVASGHFNRMCENIISEHDEQMIDLYIDRDHPLDEMQLSICAKAMTDLCTVDDFKLSFPHEDHHMVHEAVKPDIKTLKDPLKDENNDENDDENDDESDAGMDDSSESAHEDGKFKENYKLRVDAVQKDEHVVLDGNEDGNEERDEL